MALSWVAPVYCLLVIFLKLYCYYVLSNNLRKFVIIVYGKNNGELGTDCNHEESDSCRVVFRARSAVFATLIFQILLYALELKSCK